MTANVFYPALNPIAKSLGTTVEPITLSVTYYTLVQGVAPSFWGAISDVRGRRPTYLLTFLIYIGATIGLAKTQSYGALVALRCIQAFGSSSAVSNGAGVIGDLSPPKQRGSYMGMYSLGMMTAA
ncbi:putative MFS multidrug transporter [Pseudohyphozyma bogoriensis]|nr:putative MFS multidrug transporter [Pseudohyphozyma bogoriensis]